MYSVCLSLMLALASGSWCVAQVSPPDPALANSVVTIEVVVGNRPRVGSGVLLLESNLVITSQRLVRGASKAQVHLANPPRIEVGGVLAANETTDLALLKLRRELPNGVPLRPAELIPRVGDSVWMHGGVQPDIPWFAHTEVRALRGGSEQELAWNAKPGELHRAHRWITLQTPLPARALGGGLFDTQGNLVGLLTSPREETLSVSYAIDVWAIRSLLRNVAENPIALSRLKGDLVGDPARLPLPAQPGTLPPEVERRTMPVPERLQSLNQSMAEGEAVLPKVKQALEKILEAGRDLEGRVAEVQRGIAQSQAQYQDIFRNPEERKVVHTGSSKRKNGRDEEETRVQYVHSDRQRRRMRDLEQLVATAKGQLSVLEQEGQVLQYRLQLAKFEQQACERHTVQLARELFWWADPLELRPAGQTKQLLGALADVSFPANLNAQVHLARAQAQLRLRNFAACESSLVEAQRASGAELPLIQALRTRAKSLGSSVDAKSAGKTAGQTRGKSGGKGGGKGAADSLAERVDGRLLAVQVRGLLDREEYREAGQLLLRGTNSGDVDSDLFATLSLLYSTTDAGTETRQKQALPLAREALERSGGREWLSMAAAAAALARAKEPELARHWLVKCESLPEDQQRGETKTWRKALEANEPWSFDW
jgi:hypothetical protein